MIAKKIKCDKKRNKLPHLQKFLVTINDITVRFSTKDHCSHSWFLPRYAGGGVHERLTTKMLLKSLDAAQCFVDIGTYLGWYTCLASKHMPQGKVYGFEMDELNFALLRNNLIINNCKNVNAYNLAVSDSCGLLTYQREENHPSPMFRLKDEKSTYNSSPLISVGATTLDCFFQNKDLVPDVIKIDVEGAEMKVLKGMRRLIAKYKPSLFLEIHPRRLPLYNSSVSAVLSLLMKNEYRVFEIDDLRNQQPEGKLNELSPESVLERNSMLYVAAPNLTKL